MLALDIHERLGPGSQILCLGAHCDDIDIGCGGTVLTWLARCEGVHVDWIVLSGNDVREAEARASAARFLAGAGSAEVEVQRFRNGYFPHETPKIKDFFEALKKRVAPDLILTHFRDDLHQDHRVVNELTWNTFRDHTILEYEIPKYDGDLGRPNVFVEIADEVAHEKIDILMSSFASERDKNWFDERTFAALLRLRGVECQAAGGLAEAFYGRKLCL